MSYKKQELLTLREHLSSSPIFGGVCALHFCSSIDEDSLLQKMLQGPLASMNSLSSESIYDDTAMTLIIDSNSNYLPSPKPTSPTNLVPNIDHPEPSSSDISNASNGSSGYPKSTETDSSSDDNQCVPDIDDREEELLSRLHYYGDFTIDRQNKINNLTARLTNTPVANINNNTAAETEELFTWTNSRHSPCHQ
jgi:hypothetical protein